LKLSVYWSSESESLESLSFHLKYTQRNIRKAVIKRTIDQYLKQTYLRLRRCLYSLLLVIEVTNSITMNNSIIESVLSQKCLGVDLDNRLIFDIHIENLCKKICSGIGALRRIKPFVPLLSLKMLYKVLIQPYFDYCSPFVGYMREGP
jgi:hypothetical protein